MSRIPACQGAGPSSTHGLAAVRRHGVSDLSLRQRVTYSFTEGTVTIDRAEDGRMRGTFSGSATASFGRSITIQNGSFDVAVRVIP